MPVRPASADVERPADLIVGAITTPPATTPWHDLDQDEVPGHERSHYRERRTESIEGKRRDQGARTGVRYPIESP